MPLRHRSGRERRRADQLRLIVWRAGSVFNDFRRCDGTVVIGVERFLQHLGELAALNEIPFRSRFDFVV
jgi:hypothetical protein